MRKAVQGLLLCALAAGCTAINPQVGQLETFKQQAAVGNWSTIAATPVLCALDSPGCAQLHQIKGDACMRVAAAAAPLERAPDYDCAIEQYDAAIRAAADPSVDPARIRSQELEALQDRRDVSRSRQEAAPLNTRLATLAQDTISADPGQAAGYYYLASALLMQGLSEAPPQACRTLDRAAAALDQASQRPGAAPDAIGQRRRDINNARTGRCAS